MYEFIGINARNCGGSPGSLTVSSMTIITNTSMSTLGSTLSTGTLFMALLGKKTKYTERIYSGVRVRIFQRLLGEQMQKWRRSQEKRFLFSVMKLKLIRIKEKMRIRLHTLTIKTNTCNVDSIFWYKSIFIVYFCYLCCISGIKAATRNCFILMKERLASKACWNKQSSREKQQWICCQQKIIHCHASYQPFGVWKIRSNSI